ncbi:hypothetical protein SB719_01785 [Pantoea sp. SIMBA_079]|uniref:hypothetical protein n=1 Tax=Pantoea sp. SIMBA_079 TaxID=3085817 RepID=UPI003991EB44
MKCIWIALLHASAFAARKLYGVEVSQVDVWLEDGRKLLLMDRTEADRLKFMAKELNSEWTESQRAALNEAVQRIRAEGKGASNV